MRGGGREEEEEDKVEVGEGKRITGADTFVNFMCVWGSHGKLNHKSFMGPFLIQSIFVVCVCWRAVAIVCKYSNWSQLCTGSVVLNRPLNLLYLKYVIVKPNLRS